MSVRTLCMSCAIVAAFATSPAFSAPYDSGAPRASTQMNHREMGRFRLPRELKIMWHREEHARLKSMPKEQRHGWLKQQWASMSASQRDRKVAELRAKWNALPSDVRQAILEKKQQRREARRMQRADSSGGTRYANPSMH